MGATAILNPRNNLFTSWIEGKMDLQVYLDILLKINISWPWGGWKPW